MRFEVEQKHRVDSLAELMSRLDERGAQIGEPVEQTDQYFAHPARDFAKTDEALRIRTTAGRNFITYKGPKLNSATKTRRELEIPLPDGADGDRFAELLQALGFNPVAIVHKRRRPFQIEHGEHDIEGAIDDVERVGTFIELELQADEANLAGTQHIIAEVASELKLGPSERRSYLELLLENTA